MNISNINQIKILSKNKLKVHGLGLGGRKVKSIIGISINILVLVLSCENENRFYRPNMPEKLCSIGIIDVDDTILRHISFEKSYQKEYPVENIDSLRKLSFTISSSTGLLYSYKNDTTIKELKNFKIPSNIHFNLGEIYLLEANEKTTNKISAECIPTKPPSKPELITITKEKMPPKESLACIKETNPYSALINFSFDIDKSIYYAILVEGWGYSLSSSLVPWNGYLDFKIRNGNSFGFQAELPGLKILHFACSNGKVIIEESPGYAYLIEGNTIRDSKIILSLSIPYSDGYCVYEVFKGLRVKIMSIPKELYLYERSLFTYRMTSGDPFTEPIYLNGNIKGGNGVFAVCRSSDIILNFSPWF